YFRSSKVSARSSAAIVSAARSQNSTTLGCATTRGTSNAPWGESWGPSRANSTESLCCAIRASDRVRHPATHRSASSAPIRMGGNIFHTGGRWRSDPSLVNVSRLRGQNGSLLVNQRNDLPAIDPPGCPGARSAGGHWALGSHDCHERGPSCSVLAPGSLVGQPRAGGPVRRRGGERAAHFAARFCERHPAVFRTAAVGGGQRRLSVHRRVCQ